MCAGHKRRILTASKTLPRSRADLPIRVEPFATRGARSTVLTVVGKKATCRDSKIAVIHSG
jgi:hypothetical protein